MILELGIVCFATFGVSKFYKKLTKKKREKKSEDHKLVKHLQKSSHDVPEKDKDRRVDKYFKISVASFGLALMGPLYPPLAFLSVMGGIYSIIPIFQGALISLIKERKVSNSMLVSISFFLLLITGRYIILAFGGFVYLLGDKIQAMATGHSRQMITDVFEQWPRTVWIVKDAVEIEIPLKQLRINDIVAVNTGEIIPTDGIITDGRALVDQHVLTGEFQPAEKDVGDKVLASTAVLSGKIFVKTEKTGDATLIAQTAKILIDSAHHKTSIQLKGEEWADRGALPVLCASGLSLVTLGPIAAIITLRCNVGRIRVIAALATMNYLSYASKLGILVKDGRALEQLKHIDTVLFDKTGTLTTNKPKIGQVFFCDGHDEDEIIRYAATAEYRLSHPIAKAILQEAKKRNLTLPDIEDSKYRIGYGITIHLDNKIIKVGSNRFMQTEGISLEGINGALISSYENGHSLVMVAVNQKLCGAIEMQADIPSELKTTIHDLRQYGVKHIGIVSGDHKQPTKKLANFLGMDSYYYNVLPERKAEIVEQLQKEGKSVCFVGDGVNDSIAMKKADVALSLKGASSIATDAAQIVFMGGNLSNMSKLFDVSKELEKNLQNNLRIVLIPPLIILGGLFFPETFGITAAYSVKTIGTFAGIGNATIPLIKENFSNKKRLLKAELNENSSETNEGL